MSNQSTLKLSEKLKTGKNYTVNQRVRRLTSNRFIQIGLFSLLVTAWTSQEHHNIKNN